jgi:putative DNA primase/helicase
MDTEKPLLLKFDHAAQPMFIDWLTNLEQKIRAEDLPAALRAHLSKYRKLMPALALLFSLADGCLESVSLRHAQLAAGWCDYLEQHARRIYASKITLEMAAAQTIAKRLANGWKRADGRFTLRDAYRNGWSGLTTPNEARAALQVLCEYGWVRKAQVQDAMGRPSETYEINLHIREVK